jgi:hypothetical protein
MSSILIVGESGSGKSTSLRNLNGKETVLINALNKPLPFRGGAKKFGTNAIFTDNSRIIVQKIQEAEKNKNIKLIVVDDFQAIMTNAYMSTIENKGYEKFTKIGKSIWDIVNAANGCRGDLKVVLLAHAETDVNGKIKCKTVGKLVDEKISLEGMCTVVLHSKVANGKYTFLTQNDGTSIAKSPMGMFQTIEIDNDLVEVVKAIDSYYDEEDIKPMEAVSAPKLRLDFVQQINACKDVDALNLKYKELIEFSMTEEQKQKLIKACSIRKQNLISEDDIPQ